MSTSSVGNRPNTTIPKSNTKKKKKSGLAGILAAFCGTDKGHETEPTRTSAKPSAPAPSSVEPITQSKSATATPVGNNANTAASTASPTSQSVGTNNLTSTSAADPTGLENKGAMTTPAAMMGDASSSQPNAVSDGAASSGGSKAAEVVSSDRGAVDSTGAAALAPPLPINHVFNHSSLPVSPVTEMAQAGGLGRDSPAQELGMTDVEMGSTEHDRTDDGVIVPPGAGTDGVRVPLDETEGLLSAAVQPPGSGSHVNLSTSSHHLTSSQSRELLSSDTPNASIGDDSIMTDNAADSELVDQSVAGQESNAPDSGAAYTQDETMMFDEEPDEDRLIAQGGIGIPIGPDGLPAPLLPPIAPEHIGRKCLVLDLDETLLHSSFKGITSADYIVPVEIESQIHNVYVVKRPGVDNFLLKMGQIYEVVVFTASLSKYADPVLDILDIHKVVKHRLFRESCYNHRGNYVKDLSQLGREMSQSIIIDNSPASYIFHPHNAVPVSTWFNDPHDTELTDLCPFLTDLGTVDDIRGVLDGSL